MALAYALARRATPLTAPLTKVSFEGIFTGGGGDLTVVLVDGSTMVMTGLAANLWLPIHVKEVTSTTIVGGYGLFMESGV